MGGLQAALQAAQISPAEYVQRLQKLNQLLLCKDHFLFTSSQFVYLMSLTFAPERCLVFLISPSRRNLHIHSDLLPETERRLNILNTAGVP
jgi:hypothetical protein